MTHQILSGRFNPLSPRVMMIGTKTGDRMILDKGLKVFAETPAGTTYCTAKRHHGPLFNAKGVCVSGQDLLVVNYTTGRHESPAADE